MITDEVDTITETEDRMNENHYDGLQQKMQTWELEKFVVEHLSGLGWADRRQIADILTRNISLIN